MSNHAITNTINILKAIINFVNRLFSKPLSQFTWIQSGYDLYIAIKPINESLADRVCDLTTGIGMLVGRVK